MNTIFWAILTIVCSPFLLLRRRRGRKKILIIQWAKLGDLVCTTPMFRAIKQAHPDYEVHVLCRKNMAHVLKNNPFIDRIVDPGNTRRERIHMIRKERYDVAINCLPDAFSSILCIWSGAPMRINTFSDYNGHMVWWLRLFMTVNVQFQIRTRTFDHYMSLLKPLGIPAIPYTLDFFPTSKEQTITEHPYVCFNVSAGNTIKEWPAAHFAKLADHVITHLHKHVVLSTLDQKRIEQIRALSKHPDKMHDAHALSLDEAAALYKNAVAFVAVDTGPMFIAYAVGAKVVVIVGGSDPHQQIPPENDRCVHVLPPAGCEPWMFVSRSPRTATPEQLRCTQETSVEGVAAALEEVLK